MKLVAVVVTYYPDIEDTIVNIMQYINFIDKLIIWENTPNKDIRKYKIEIPKFQEKIIYLGTGSNEGISYALNQSIEWGIDNEYTHILTMDQDSYFCNFEYYKDIVVKNVSIKNTGIYSPNINKTIPSSPNLIEVKFSITSGSIFDLSAFNTVGFFREDYFIDAVDLEFCIRAKRYNIPTFIVSQAHLNQSFGNLTKTSLGFHSNNYSVFRTFHIVRNHIWLWKEYPEIHSFKMFNFLFRETIFNRSIKILLGESSKYAKYKALCKGIYTGLRKKNSH